jgi:dTDP-4-amino-4,6-dideoxygalactose transaminase
MMQRYRHIGVGTFSATPKMWNNIAQVLESGQISYGQFSREFERRFATLHGRKYGVLSNSGTSSLQVSLEAMKMTEGWEDGAEVIVPATTFVATPNVVVQAGLTPVFVDVDPLTYCMNIYDAMQAVTPHTVAIMPVNLLGQSADYRGLYDLIEQNGYGSLKVIEDSCEAMFVTHHSNPVGSWGHIGCFSTYVAHLLVTGVGGIAITDNPSYAARMRSLVNHGLALEQLNPDDNFSPRPSMFSSRRFIFDMLGHSYRITELEAALGCAGLDDYKNNMSARTRNAETYIQGIRELNREFGQVIEEPCIAQGNVHAWMMMPIVLSHTPSVTNPSKESLMSWLNNFGIETRDLLPLVDQPVYKDYIDPAKFPVSSWLLDSGFYVGVHQGLNTEDVQFVLSTLRGYFSYQMRNT